MWIETGRHAELNVKYDNEFSYAQIGISSLKLNSNDNFSRSRLWNAGIKYIT